MGYPRAVRPRRTAAAAGLAAALVVVGTAAACARPAPPVVARSARPVEAAQARSAPAPASPVRLVVLIVTDQLATESLERFRPLLTGGLARLLAEGTSFRQAHHAHAMTTTAPGHASLATGRWPRHHGVVANAWYDRAADTIVESVDDERFGKSPSRLLAPTLGSWLKAAHPAARVFAASGKDRGALLLAGRDADGAFWYDDGSGLFRSSDYYPHPRPEWLRAFHAGPARFAWFGRPWTPLRPLAPEEAAAFGIVELDEGVYPRRFPHPVGGDTTWPGGSYWEDVFETPLVDELLAALARDLVAAERLGADAEPDLLALSFSGLDSVGHAFGHHSPEVLDTVLRLDGLLGRLLAELETGIGREHLLLALSADHGVAPVTEAVRAGGGTATREDASHVACVQSTVAALDGTDGAGPWFVADGVLAAGRLGADGLPQPAVERAVAAHLAGCPQVVRVWTARELAAPQPPPGPFGGAYWRAYHHGRSPHFLVQYAPTHLERQWRGTTHHSPYPYDTHVPLLFWGAGVAPGTVDEPVATVDLAPTLAALLGLPAPQGVDGRDLTPLLPPAAAR
jgi:predicted AlkP superfamily pyrophosphatase or phosphodiesterase